MRQPAQVLVYNTLRDPGRQGRNIQRCIFLAVDVYTGGGKILNTLRRCGGVCLPLGEIGLPLIAVGLQAGNRFFLAVFLRQGFVVHVGIKLIPQLVGKYIPQVFGSTLLVGTLDHFKTQRDHPAVCLAQDHLLQLFGDHRLAHAELTADQEQHGDTGGILAIQGMQAAQLIAAAKEGFRIADGVIHADFLLFRQELQRHFTAIKQQIIAALDQGADLYHSNDVGVFFLHAEGGLFRNIGIDLERNMPQRLLIFIRILLFRQQHGVAVAAAQRQAAGNRQSSSIPFFFTRFDAVAQCNVHRLQRAASHILHIALQRSRLAGIVITIVVFLTGAVVGRGRIQRYFHLRADIQLFLLMFCQHTHKLMTVLLGGGTLQQTASLLLLHQILLVLVIKVLAGFPDRLDL